MLKINNSILDNLEGMLFISFFLITTIQFSNALPTCNIKIVESIPQYLTYEASAFVAPPISEAWKDLISSAKKYVRINSLYWSMLSKDTNTTDSSAKIGDEVFRLLTNKAKVIPIQINHDVSNASCYDMKILKSLKNVNVSLINVTRLVGNGIQHSKLLISDGNKAFVGSANMDWRSLSQVKEIGAYITSCLPLISDLEAFWLAINYLSGPHSQIPKVWPRNTWPKYNITNPFKADVNGVPMLLYTATSPSQFNPPFRTFDLDAILSAMKEAKEYLLISVMDFLPLNIDYKHETGTKYWPDIEDAIKHAAINKRVKVKILISLWSHSDSSTLIFLRSLADVGKKIKYLHTDLIVKVFIIPAFNEFQRNLPFSRVSHSKYMVTDSTLYIGTSNWSGNYFNGTIGLSLVAKENCRTRKCKSKSIRGTMEDIFFVDWNSIYAHDL